MSSPDKPELLAEAKTAGYRTYLYFCTEDSDINKKRVRSRISLGGHSVQEEKISERYVRSLLLLRTAILNADRAYILDKFRSRAQVYR